VPLAENGGICLFRAPLPLTAATNWQGWAGTGWMDLPASYPTAPQPLPCAPIQALSSRFRFSWSYNVSLSPPQFILIGLETSNSHVVTPSCPAANSSVAADSQEAFVYTTVTADLANGEFTVVMPETCLLRINWFDQSGPNDPTNTGEAYPSLLDPASPTLQPRGGVDLNFQYSGSQPYLYAVRLNPYNKKTNPNYYDRDVVRWQLSVSPAGQAKTR
jgi:hypothetical protein